jgi:hypothetical protein
VTAFLTAPKHGYWLFAGAVIVLYIVAKLCIPSRRECCGHLHTPTQYEAHLKVCHHAE